MAVSQERATERFVAETPLDVARIRADFPILSLRRGDMPLVYLDNAATMQKPRQVIEALTRFYTWENANIHRGVHELSMRATAAYDEARRKVTRFLNARLPCEIVFTRGATEGINLVAECFGKKVVGSGDEVLVTHMEHHANIVPWQRLCAERGARLVVAPVTDSGELLLDDFERLFTPRTRMVAVTHMSNALGTINPVKDLVALAHDQGVPVLVDGAQSTAHVPVDLQDSGCDFFVCSGHKMAGPTGIGVLYGKAEHLEAMPPYQVGGDMVLSVTMEKTIYNSLPHKFEAGTPHIAGAVGLGAAIDYLTAIGMERIEARERELLAHGAAVLNSIPGVHLVGTARKKGAILSFIMDCAHPHDVGQILDNRSIAIRTGHHCAQPVMERLGLPATARASLAFYNTKEELDALGEALYAVKEVFE